METVAVLNQEVDPERSGVKEVCITVQLTLFDADKLTKDRSSWRLVELDLLERAECWPTVNSFLLTDVYAGPCRSRALLL